MFIPECLLPPIGQYPQLQLVNKTGIKSHLPYDTVLEYECATGYGFLSNASTHTTHTVKCEDSATFGKLKNCTIKGMELR